MKTKSILFMIFAVMISTAILVSCTDTTPVPEKYTVSFDSNGGSVVPSQTVEKGKKADEPSNPARIENISGYDADYVFDGWFYGEIKWDFANMTVTKDMTLIARWHNEWAPPV